MPLTSAAPIISVAGVTKTYGGVAAVDDLHLDIGEGEFLSLLGPSGCGKTTLLRMIGGFEEPDRGDILLKGSSVIGVPANKRTVNTVFQAYALFPHMTVAENVAYGLRQRKVPRSEIGTRVGDALRLVQMGDFADRPPKKLSGGQQQRVALARAIVNRPDVLLLDEPMSALDRQLREQMQVELKLIQRKVGITFVFVTHDQEEALSMSDRVVVMRDGRIEQIGTSQEVYETPASSFVASFIGKQNFSPATVRPGGLLEAADAVFVPAADITAFAAGSAVQATVRAEAMSISATDPVRDHNVVRGTLAGSSFLGDVIQHIVITDAGRELLVRIPAQGSVPLTTGAPVWCAWEPAAVHVFAAEIAAA